MPSPTLVLLPLGPARLDPGMAPWLAGELAAELGLEARVGAGREVDARWAEVEGGPFRADAVLDTLILGGRGADTGETGEWVLALTDADLAAPGRPYVFGEATVGGRWALLGLARLADPTPGSLRLRALKVALHEIGHLAGLAHCGTAACAMRPAAAVAGLDRRPAAFCGSCAEHLNQLRAT